MIREQTHAVTLRAAIAKEIREVGNRPHLSLVHLPIGAYLENENSSSLGRSTEVHVANGGISGALTALPVHAHALATLRSGGTLTESRH